MKRILYGLLVAAFVFAFSFNFSTSSIHNQCVERTKICDTVPGPWYTPKTFTQDATITPDDQSTPTDPAASEPTVPDPVDTTITVA